MRLQGIIAYVYFSKCGNKIVQLRPSKSEEKTNNKKKRKEKKKKNKLEKNGDTNIYPSFITFGALTFSKKSCQNNPKTVEIVSVKMPSKVDFLFFFEGFWYMDIIHQQNLRQIGACNH